MIHSTPSNRITISSIVSRYLSATTLNFVVPWEIDHPLIESFSDEYEYNGRMTLTMTQRFLMERLCT